MASYEQPGTPTEPNPSDQPAPEEASLTDWSSDGGEDSPNLVPFFLSAGEPGKKWLSDTVAKQACGDTKQGWDDSEEFRQARARVNRLYTGFLKKKTFPYDGCANIHIPLMLECLQRLGSNIYGEIFEESDMVFGVKPTGPDDYETAEILTIHANWRLRNELTDFLTQMDKAVMEFLLAGSVFAYSWRDQDKRRNRHDILTCDEFVVPYTHKTDMVDLSDVPWKTRIIRRYRHELEAMRDTGEWDQVDAVLKKDPPPHDFMDGTTREVGEQREKIRMGDGKTSPYVFFEYHGWLRMPGETKQRPICATVSADEKIVVKFYIREEPDWRDQMRFDRQDAELSQYQEQSAAYPQLLEQHAAKMAQPMMPEVDPMTGQVKPPKLPELPPAPVPPTWAKPAEDGSFAPEPVRRVPIEMFSHGKCSYNPDGMLGLGFGAVLGPFNEASDEAMNRFYDQATANNVPVNLTLGEVLPGNTALVPGKNIPIKTAGVDDIRKLIYELRPGPANPQLLDIVRELRGWGESAVAAPGVMSGQPGKSGETFRGLATRAEKATKQLSAAGKKLIQFLEQIFRNDAKLLANFLPDEELVQVNDHLAEYRKFTMQDGPPGPPDPVTGQPTPGPKMPASELRITRDMYRRNYDVTFTADLRFTSQAQKVAEADEVLAMVNQTIIANPMLAPFGLAILHASLSECLRARRKQDLIPLLGPPPPPPPVPMGTPPPASPPPPPGMAPPPGAPQPGGPPPPGPQPQPGAPPS